VSLENMTMGCTNLAQGDSYLDKAPNISCLYFYGPQLLSDVMKVLVGVVWLLSLIEPLHLIGLWFGEDQRKSTM
jgi:hypothetical protein